MDTSTQGRMSRDPDRLSELSGVGECPTVKFVFKGLDGFLVETTKSTIFPLGSPLALPDNWEDGSFDPTFQFLVTEFPVSVDAYGGHQVTIRSLFAGCYVSKKEDLSPLPLRQTHPPSS